MKLLLILLIPIQILFKSEAEANLAYITNGNLTSLADSSLSTIVYGVNITADASGDISLDSM